MKIPKFLLRKLYVKNSLRPIENGFEITIKNVLANATIIAPVEIIIDGKNIPADNITLESPEGTVKSSDISANNALSFPVKMEVKIIINNYEVSPGDHKIEIKTKTKEYGDIEFDIKDKV